MAIPIDKLIKKVSVEELKKTAFDALVALGFPVASWSSVAVIRTLVVLFCRLLSPFTDAAALIASSGFLDHAIGAALTLLAKQVYNVDRRLATRATGEITLTNTAGGSYTFAAYQARFLSPTGKLYQNTAAFTLAPLQVGLVVPIEALEAGMGSTAIAGSIVRVEPALIGVQCTNAAALIGSDEESDEALRARCRAKLGSLSANGPRSAYDFISQSYELNGGVVVTRSLTLADSPIGEVTHYIAGPTGSITAPDVAKVQDAIARIAYPTTIDVTVLSAIPITLDITATLYVYTSENLTSAEVQALALARLIDYVPTIPIGGHRAGTNGVRVSSLEGELKAAGTPETVRRGPIHAAEVTTPSTDVAMSLAQVVVLGTVTLSVVLEAPPGAA